MPDPMTTASYGPPSSDPGVYLEPSEASDIRSTRRVYACIRAARKRHARGGRAPSLEADHARRASLSARFRIRFAAGEGSLM